MPRTYIKKALRQKSKSKTDTTSPQPSTASHPAPAQVDIQGAEKLAGTCLDTLRPDPSTTTEDKVERVRALHSKWSYEDTEEVVEGADHYHHPIPPHCCYVLPRKKTPLTSID